MLVFYVSLYSMINRWLGDVVQLQVGRAFSFNKTPSKLKRAVSTIMTSPFGSTNSLTPASQLAQMKLASCNNINVSVVSGNHRNPRNHLPHPHYRPHRIACSVDAAGADGGGGAEEEEEEEDNDCFSVSGNRGN